MLLTFGDYELDTRLYALRRGGQACEVEPQVFNLLAYLVRHRDRVVSRQELMDALWTGKVIGEATLSSCVKAARQAVGDDGTAQRRIATIARRGFRFVDEVRERPPASPATSAIDATAAPNADAGASSPPQLGRASLAVMPFADLGPAAAGRGGIADALAHDIITRLAQLRSLLVIARGTMFALSERGIGPDEAARLLNADYLVTGTVRRRGRRLIVTTELVETRSSHIVWAEIFDEPLDEALRVLDDIGGKIVATTANEVEAAERQRAILRPPNSLNAWESLHRGFWHMYRFTRDDNDRARQFFETAARLDPSLSRAYAGLSFTHFQSAFLGWGERDAEIERACATAGQSLGVDNRNPSAHWAMGRALWLRGHHDQSVAELEQAIDLSPSFALGHYTLAFVLAQAGDPRAAIASTDHARVLSPYDPLLFGMLGARAIALVRLERFAEAARCAVEAAARPNAHVHILAIAACSLALAGSIDEARTQVEAIRGRQPRYGVADLLRAFQLDARGRALFREAAGRIGLS